MPTRPPGTPDVDLTFDGSSGSINFAVFATEPLQSAGTGQFNSFVQIQHTGTERGYNTDASAEFDEKNAHNHNHSVLLADVPIVFGDGSNGTAEGVTYREFLLDLNENSGKQFISLDALQIWQEESGSLTNFTPGVGFAGAHTNYLAYNLDAGGDHWVALTDGLSHGSGQSDYVVLIPDSFFINDAAHRYVTLYSQFGLQAGWASDGGVEEWGLTGTSGGARSALSIQKTATVPDGTADTPGEVISYAISVSNTGNTALTGITVTDSTASNLAPVLSLGFNVGDTNHDNQLSAGETWQYTADHTVTQDDIDTNGGGDGVINNTATADSNETTPVSASALVTVEQRSTVELVKTADVSSVDAAGDVINYTVTVENTGNVTQTNPVVTDPAVVNNPIVDTNDPVLNPNAQQFVQLRDGDFNLGDDNNNGIVDPTDQNGARDPGETWQYVYLGDTNQDGFHDPGETWTAFNLGDTNNDGIHQVGEIWVGDSNQNGVQEDGEKWQFKNVWDTNNNGLQDNDEVWHYQNLGDNNQNGVQDPGETFEYYNAGDTNQNGTENAGETFQYYNAGDTNHNGEEDPGETFQFSHVLPGVETINPGFNDGDTNQDGKINSGETWQFAASYTVTQDDIDNRNGSGVPIVDPALTRDNTASVATDQGASASGSESVAIVQNPHVTLVKSASVADGTADAAGDVIDYTIDVTNDGNMTLTGPVVSDPSVTGLAAVESGRFNAGDANQDGELDLGETWQYTAHHTVTQGDIDNGGVVNPALTYNNTASVTTDQGRQPMNADPDANDTGSASVSIVQNPHVTLSKSAAVVGGVVDAAGDVIHYRINVTNDGNMTLTNPVVSDPSVTDLAAVLSGGFNAGDTDQDGKLDLGETWKYTASYTATQDDIDNGGVVNPTLTHDNTASVTTDQGRQPMNADPDANDTGSASVPIMQNPQIVLDKTATVPGDTADTAGEVISYSITIHNGGNMTLTNPVVTDPSVSDLAPVMSGGFNAGDTDQDGKVDVGETWQYSASHTVTQSDLDTNGGGDGTIDNTASVTTDQGASSSDSASVTVVQPTNASISVVKTALGYHDLNSDNMADAGDTVEYGFTVTNTGNVTLHTVGVVDVEGDTTVTGGPLATLAPGASDLTSFHAFYTIQPGETTHDNEAVAVSDEASAPSGTVHVVFADLFLLMT